MKPIGFIGARGGSKGVPRKNIRKLGNKPLIAHTIQTALKSKIFSHIIVSTEDKEIARIAKKYGAEVPFVRPKKLATDNVNMGDVMIHGIKKLREMGYKFDVLVNLDCTVPFIESNDVKRAVALLKKKKCNAVFGAYRQHFNPYFNIFEKDYRGYLKLCKPLKNRPRSRQEAPIVYQMIGLIAYDVNSFLKYQKVILPKSLLCEIPPEHGVMIDTKLEFKIAEMMLR